MNLIRRKIPVTKVPKNYTNQQVFYIVWHRDESEFFLCDANADGDTLHWSVFKEHAVRFTEGEEALGFCKEINTIKRGPGIIELKIVDEKVRADDDDDIWMI